MQSKVRDIEPYWTEETDWLCVIEFLPSDDEQDRAIGAEAIGYLFGYAQLTDTRMLALIGDPEAGAYELLFSFVSPESRAEFLKLLDSDEYLGGAYEGGEFGVPNANDIKAARPLAMVLPEDVMRQATLIATTLLVASDDDQPSS